MGLAEYFGLRELKRHPVLKLRFGVRKFGGLGNSAPGG
jgi:hypothetical protein